MVHAFSYYYKTKDVFFLWDTESGSLHNVDSATFLLAKKRYSMLSCMEEKQLLKLKKDEVSEIEKELDQLEKSGVLASIDDCVCDAKDYSNVKALCLHICHDCNLRCEYCFAAEGTYKMQREYMSFEVGKSAVDFLIKNSGERKNLEIDFFGGEPLMNLEVIKKIVAYARSREKETKKVFSFTLTTNCVLLNDDTINYLNEEMSNVVLSIDGRKAVHNCVRKTLNGKDCFDLILSNAKKFADCRGDKSYYVRGTFTAKNLDFCDDVLFLADCGFKQISLEPVVTDISHLEIREEHLPAILNEYEKLAKVYLTRRREGKWFNFFHFMLDLENGPCLTKRLTGCGSGCEYLSVIPNGDIYPCHQFAGISNYNMGNVLKGIFSREVSVEFSQNIVTKKPDCKNCFAKYYCSGGCAANNKNFSGGINKPYKISCEMMKKRFELSLAIAAIEKTQN